MKRIGIIMLSILLILTGCERRSPLDIVDDVISEAAQYEPYTYRNSTKQIYDYYLPNDVKIKQSGPVSNVLTMDGYDVIMNVDISAIMNQSETFVDVKDNKFVVNKTVTLKNLDEKETTYRILIEALDETYLVVLESYDMRYISVVPLASIEPVLEKMILIARTLKVDQERVIATYSNKEVIDYHHEAVEIFSENIPESGYINEVSGEKAVDFEGIEQDAESD